MGIGYSPWERVSIAGSRRKAAKPQPREFWGGPPGPALEFLHFAPREGGLQPARGLSLAASLKQGEYCVAGIATRNGQATVEGVQAGDKLVQIDALRTNAASREAIFAAMHGKSGDPPVLILERDGRQFQVQARVTAF